MDTFPGHAAWLDWPWKLHRIEGKKGDVEYQLYSLLDDPMEENNLLEQHPQRVKKMKAELKKWQVSVLESLNGKDYH